MPRINVTVSEQELEHIRKAVGIRMSRGAPIGSVAAFVRTAALGAANEVIAHENE